ncbi:MAG TPA: hypothetical protein VHJ58_15200, partial [Vicinamibacterales bacterium]|nr:hypothetical protein [Vicinamibacterales bacterium]
MMTTGMLSSSPQLEAPAPPPCGRSAPRVSCAVLVDHNAVRECLRTRELQRQFADLDALEWA